MTYLDMSGPAALSLDDGVESQVKYFLMRRHVGSAILTPRHLANGKSIAFDEVGDSAYLVFIGDSWVFMGGTASLNR